LQNFLTFNFFLLILFSYQQLKQAILSLRVDQVTGNRADVQALQVCQKNLYRWCLIPCASVWWMCLRFCYCFRT